MVEAARKPGTSSTNGIVTQPSSIVNNESPKILSDRDITPISKADIQKAESHFRTTKNYDVAGYLLTDGKMLDFSGKHWGDTSSTYRQVDHRDIWEVWEYEDFDGTEEMVNLIGNGNIRHMPESGGINLAVKPNAAQSKPYIWRGVFTLTEKTEKTPSDGSFPSPEKSKETSRRAKYSNIYPRNG